jgi:hypothetical protein
MTIRAKRRLTKGGTLEEMSNDDLIEIRFFGNVVCGRETVYTATREEQCQASEILKAREGNQSMPDDAA